MMHELLLSLRNNWRETLMMIGFGLLVIAIVAADIISIERQLNREE
jgi:hypothetical protein